eukprot:4042777-Ditylum_brightwellii.AAC.1
MHGGVVNVPNSKKRTNYYELLYDKGHCNDRERKKFTTKVKGSKYVKEDLKAAFQQTAREDYCFGGIKKKTATEATPLSCPGTRLIPGIMHKRNISNHAASVQALMSCDDSDDKSLSDDGSNYDINDCTFVEGGAFDRGDEKSDNKEEIHAMDL